jgi:hypothetical protein
LAAAQSVLCPASLIQRQELTLSHASLPELCALAALEMPRLTTLNFCSGSSGFDQLSSGADGRVATGMRAVAGAPWFSRLRSLTIDCEEPPTFDNLAGYSAPCLTILELRCERFTDAAAVCLGQLALPSLRVLYLWVTSGLSPPVTLTARGVAALLAAEGLTGSLQELCITQHNTSLMKADAVLAAIARTPLAALRTLIIRECRHTDASIAAVASASWASQLTYLEFSSVDGRFHRKGAAWGALAAAPLESLRELDLHFEPRMSAGVAAHLMTASWLCSLERLCLSGLSRGAFEVLQATATFASLQASQRVDVSQVEAEPAAAALAAGAAG